MPDLTPGEVRALLAAIGLSTEDDEDLEEVTHRINAINEALAALEPEGLDAQEPVTIFGRDEIQS
ncbi:MAG TPA: hypothetical protein VJB57_07080 [Dehalococcoidia bacterium]|nr:hypothetical protein [Dehalococcoidia bacterium]